MKDISIISAHFKDFDWIELLINQIKLNSEISNIREIIIINQDRCESSKIKLQQLHELIRVVEFPVSEKHFQIQGHDHAAVLNAAVLEASGDYICIFDSDAHPISNNWMSQCSKILEDYDAILAESPDGSGTHPCFMVFKNEHKQLSLAFDERLFEDRVDTGRLIGQQLSRAGQKVFYSEPRRCFSGLWGTTYMDAVYHHGNGSFHASGPLLTAQVTWLHHFFRERVLYDRQYEFTLVSSALYHLQSAYLKCKFGYLKPVKSRLLKMIEGITSVLFRKN
jgi:glycosyltransferase involved in cell wall biosynthesis